MSSPRHSHDGCYPVNDDEAVSVDDFGSDLSRYERDDDDAVANDRERHELARKENAVVQGLRGMVFMALLAATVGVSTRVYVYTMNDQVRDFEQAFVSDATKLLDSFQNSVKRRIEAIDSLGVAITSHAMTTNATFPFVTLPAFGIRSANSRVLSGSVFVQYQPVVTDAQRPEWEAYSRQHRSSLYEQALQTELALLHEQNERFNQTRLDILHEGGRTLEKVPLADPTLWRDSIENLTPNGTSVMAPNGTGPYLPNWLNSPVTPQSQALINFNSLSHPAAGGSFKVAMLTGQAVIETASNLAGEHLGRTGLFFKAMLSASQYRNDVEEYLGEPVSSFAYPVFDSFVPLSNRKVVAILGSSLYWRLYFKNVLLANATRGIYCVLSNTRNQTFSFHISSDKVEYLGSGDYHDPAFDYLVQERDVAQAMGTTLSAETKSYTSVDLNTDYCRYTIRIYPSEETKALYVNGDPMYLTMVILSVFLLTSFIFIMFSVAVNRRQRVIMDRAVASSAIVSSLFPTQVRDQIYEENNVVAVGKKSKNTWSHQRGPEATENQGDSTEVAFGLSPQRSPDTTGPRPIANLFEATTVMFADMVGFTQWSSTRNPVQVFELLETLYRAFDAIAVRRNVFKVETIGDCYVAVTGLPEPQDDHAVIMARFASECMTQMNQLTTELAATLGVDTANLSLRVGLHSGSVTGGVLRGQKSRFQLFGDTMNTAARMESHGAPGLIHASQETIDELMRKGKQNWVSARKDKITAKGKGELQTYWVSPRSLVRSTQVVSDVVDTEQMVPETDLSEDTELKSKRLSRETVEI